MALAGMCRLEKGDTLSELCCFPHWPLLRYCNLIVQCTCACVLICACLAELINPATAGLQEKACDRWFWQILVLVSYFAVENGSKAAKRKGKLPCSDFTPWVRKFPLEEGEIVLSWDQHSRKAQGPSRRGKVEERRMLQSERSIHFSSLLHHLNLDACWIRMPV